MNKTYNLGDRVRIIRDCSSVYHATLKKGMTGYIQRIKSSDHYGLKLDAATKEGYETVTVDHTMIELESTPQALPPEYRVIYGVNLSDPYSSREAAEKAAECQLGSNRDIYVVQVLSKSQTETIKKMVSLTC